MGMKVDLVNVVDLEATIGHTENKLSEMVEIGICVLDLSNWDKPVIKDKKSMFILPGYTAITEECTKLTTITPEQVAEHGIPFYKACEILENEYKSRDRIWASWGDYDRLQFMRQIDLFNNRYPSTGCDTPINCKPPKRSPWGRRHINIKTLCALFHGLKGECGVDEGCELLDIKWKGTRHRGDDDAEMAAEILMAMIEDYRLFRDPIE